MENYKTYLVCVMKDMETYDYAFSSTKKDFYKDCKTYLENGFGIGFAGLIEVKEDLAKEVIDLFGG